jgi:hypothetical protein
MVGPTKFKNKISEPKIVQKLALVFSLVCIFGCSPIMVQPSPEGSPDLQGIPATDLIGALRVSQADLRSLDALGKISVSTPENRLRASQVVLVQAPDSFRIEVLAPFGISYVVATDGEALATLSTQDNVLYRGRPDQQTIAEVIGIALAPRDMASLLLGRPPVEADELASLWKSNPPANDAPAKVGAPAVFLHAGDSEDASVVIGFTKLRADRYEQIVPVSFQRIARNGQKLLQASFEDFVRVDEVLVPRRIRLQTLSTSAVVEYRELTPNKRMPASMFQIATPPGTREISLLPAAP